MSFRNIAVRSIAVGSAFLIAGCAETPGDPAAREDLAPSYARSETAQARLAAIFPETSADVMSLPGTVFADHDETVGKLVFGVENANAIPGIQRALSARGIASSEYAIEVTEPIRHLATLRDTFRPMIGGIQIHFGNYVCTLGFNATHVQSGERSFITNSHCTNTQGGVEGTTYAQPSRTVDATIVATEVADPVYTKGGVCPKGKKCRWSDASRAHYNSAVGSTLGEIALTTGPNNNSLTFNGSFNLSGQASGSLGVTVGTTVNKVGRTTGWTQGPVSRTCVNTNVQGSQVHQLCQVFVTAGVNSGDSGSPVFSNNVLVGILWGGSTSTFVFSPFHQIEQELGALNAN